MLINTLLAAIALIAAAFALICAMQARGTRRRARTLADQLQTSHQSLADVRSESAALTARLEETRRQLEVAGQRVDAEVRRGDGLQVTVSEQRGTIAELQTRLDEQRRQADEKLKLLESARERLTQEFQNLANRIFDEKSQKFTDQNRTQINTVLTPLREQLKDFRDKVESVHLADVRAQSELRQQLVHLKELNQQVTREAANLTKALKGDSKKQGSWGELILERVLEESGLRKGHEYDTQVRIGGSQPDVIVRLPDGKDVVVDSKVSLLAYERAVSAEQPELRQRYLAEHCSSMKTHARALGGKDYADLPGLRSLDFVLMFVPVEAAFLEALEQDPRLFTEAFERKVVMVSPTTLLATLRIIENLWRHERQNRNAEKIADEAGKLYDQFARFYEELQGVGEALEKARERHEDAMKRLVSGRGNLMRKAENLRKLGARTKRALPAEFVDEDASYEETHDSEPVGLRDGR